MMTAYPRRRSNRSAERPGRQIANYIASAGVMRIVKLVNIILLLGLAIGGYSNVSAQSVDYYIQIHQQTNIRVAPDINDDNIQFSVPARTNLRVTYEGINGNWLKVKHNGRSGWLARWVGWHKISRPQPQAAPATAVPVTVPSIREPQTPNSGSSDNKCKDFGWNCETDADWENGYWAKICENNGHNVKPNGIYRAGSTCVADSNPVSNPEQIRFNSNSISGRGNKVIPNQQFTAGRYISTFRTSNTGYGYGFGAVKVFGDCFRWLGYDLVHNVSRAGRHEKVFVVDYSCTATIEISNSRGKWTLAFEPFG